jgi:SAM-dependent methyltransferase
MAQPEAPNPQRRGSAGDASAAQYDAIADLYDGYPGCYLEDIPFFLEEAGRAAGPVLEIGVGTGRLALVLAAAGVDVVGIDSSPAMLHVLARKRAQWPNLPGRVRALAADMRRFALRQRFPLATIPFRAFLYLLTRTDQRQALRAIRRHLLPDGRLLMAFFVPPPSLLAGRNSDRVEMTRFPAPDGAGGVVAYDWTEAIAHQRLISHLTYQWVNGRGRPIREMQHSLVCRYLRPEEVPPLLEGTGYRVVAAYGGFDRRPLTADSHEQIWIAERAEK